MIFIKEINQATIKISDYFDFSVEQEKDEAANFIMKEINEIASYMFQAWNAVEELIKIDPNNLINVLKVDYNINIKERHFSFF